MFSWHPPTDRWAWNDAMFRIHGYEPHAVVPTRALLLAHIDPHDRDHAADAVAAAAVRQEPWCLRHRLVTVDGRTREVVSAGGPRRPGGHDGGHHSRLDSRPDRGPDRDAVADDAAASGGENAGDATECSNGRVLRGYLIPLPLRPGAEADPAPDDRSPAPASGDAAGPAPDAETIPAPRGRNGASGAYPPDGPDGAAAADAPVAPAPRESGRARSGEPADARHAEAMRHAHDTLVAGLDLTHEAASTLLSWLANTHEVPPVAVAEVLADLPRDATTARPDLAALLAVLDAGPDG